MLEQGRTAASRPGAGPSKRGSTAPANRYSWLSGAFLVALVVAIGVLTTWREGRNVEVVAYSVFESHLRDGRFAEVQVGDRSISGRYALPHDGKTGVVAALVEPAIADRLAPYGVPYARVHESTWLGDLVSWLAGPLLVFGLWFAMSRRIGGAAGAGLLGIGRSRAKVYAERSTGVRFADVAGVDEAKAELQEMVDFLRDPVAHGRLGARIPKGVLLMGPTGTGKTLLARAVAGEAEVPFFSISGSEFIEMFVGVGAARVRDLFDQARAAAPAIIFIDEIDALGKTRAPGNVFGGHDEREQTLNQLLVELDGFDPSIGVVLLAATNRPETLDPALLRAGRFDRQVLVDRPDRRGRCQILAVHARKIRLAPDVDLDQVAAITVGFAGADLANVVNEAALVATRREGLAVTLDDFTAAIERIVAGIEKKNRPLGAEERRLVAYHELGHALAALTLPGADRVHKVSIVPHGVGALGYTLQRPSQDRHLLRRSELIDKMTILLAGRAAEQLVFGEPSTGAADDLARATDLARDMVLRHGMDERLGPVCYADAAPVFVLGQGEPARAERAGPATAERIDAAIRALLGFAQDRAGAILQANRQALDRCAAELMARETLDEGTLRTLAATLVMPRDVPLPAKDRVDAAAQVAPPAVARADAQRA